MKLRTRTIHFRAENTASDNEKQLWAHQKPGTLYMDVLVSLKRDEPI